MKPLPPSEHEIQSEIFRVIGARPDVRLWRNNVGRAWAGQLVRCNADGSVLLANARPLHAGLFNGSADLIGLQSRVITPDDVGHRFARFLSIEVKTPISRLSPAQRAWRSAINQNGGIAFVARNVEDAEAELDLTTPRP